MPEGALWFERAVSNPDKPLNQAIQFLRLSISLGFEERFYVCKGCGHAVEREAGEEGPSVALALGCWSETMHAPTRAHGVFVAMHVDN